MTSPDARPSPAKQQPLLPDHSRHDEPPAGAAAAWSVPWLTLLGFAFLTFNSVMAVYRAQGDRAAIAFVAFSYLDLLALFACLRWYETAGDALRRRLKPAVWLLTTALTVVFSWKVAAVMPAGVAVVVWLMAFATVAGGFYAFFFLSDEEK
ncbi:hypothetical protein ACP4OV_009272 [Aristida adscensionis]